MNKTLVLLLLACACGGPAVLNEPSAPADAGAAAPEPAADPDAGNAANTPDAGPAAAPDAGTQAPPDAGTADAGTQALPDAGAADAGTQTTLDAGPADAGTQAAPDAGSSGAKFDASKPWAASYGPASKLGTLSAVGTTYGVVDLDLDPAAGNFTPTQVAQIRAGGARVISYLDVGSCEKFRSYWTSAPAGFVPCAQNTKAWRGSYAGYPDEVWMNLADPDWQDLIVNYAAPLLVEMGADGFYLDNLEMVEHGTQTQNGPCDAACSQGGLDLVRRLREKYPDKIIIMQNATSDVTRLGQTGGVPYASLLDGISHEEVFAPAHDASAEAELKAWRDLPHAAPFWIATEDYVGSCTALSAAQGVYARSKADGFHPYATDASARQQAICWWGF